MINEIIKSSAASGVFLSLAAYEIGVVLRKKTGLAFLNPLLVANVLMITFLVLFHVEYESYNSSARYISYLLTPATVSLAIPLYLKLDVLKQHFVAIMTAILAGVITSLVSILLLSMLFGLSHAAYVTLLPKSITTAIGIGVSEELGGFSAITVATIIITGILGYTTAEAALKIFRITDPIAKGLAIGTAAHAVGTAKAMELGETEGAMSSLSIVVAGVLTVIGASLFAALL